MPRFAHISDIHYRPLTRHDEFREIFTRFAEDCRNNAVDHIVVGGDIYHLKTSSISPEVIQELSWWLTTLASVAEVHVTLGNHDGNLVNLSRQDAISPIIAALNNPKIHLYKYSGVYRIEPGYNLCVFSCFDVEGWKNVKPVPGEFNIATFHGPVNGSITDLNLLIDDHHVSVDFFKEYDICMLGDIHKMQFLGQREVELQIDETELTNYPTAIVLER